MLFYDLKCFIICCICCKLVLILAVLFLLFPFYFAPIAVQSIVINASVYLSVCLSVCLHISKNHNPDFIKFSVHVTCGRDLVLLCQ